MRKLAAVFIVLLSILYSISGAMADSFTHDKNEKISFCEKEAASVLKFADYRDHGLSKEEAFNAFTQGRAVSKESSMLNGIESIAYEHPKYKPEAVAAFTYGECVLTVLNLFDQAIADELMGNVKFCQKKYSTKPNELRKCANDKTADIIAAHSADVLYKVPPSESAKEMSDTEFSAYFKCPEVLGTQEEKDTMLKDYYSWAVYQHPIWTKEDLQIYLARLMDEHQCAPISN